MVTRSTALNRKQQTPSMVAPWNTQFFLFQSPHIFSNGPKPVWILYANPAVLSLEHNTFRQNVWSNVKCYFKLHYRKHLGSRMKVPSWISSHCMLRRPRFFNIHHWDHGTIKHPSAPKKSGWFLPEKTEMPQPSLDTWVMLTPGIPCHSRHVGCQPLAGNLIKGHHRRSDGLEEWPRPFGLSHQEGFKEHLIWWHFGWLMIPLGDLTWQQHWHSLILSTLIADFTWFSEQMLEVACHLKTINHLPLLNQRTPCWLLWALRRPSKIFCRSPQIIKHLRGT